MLRLLATELSGPDIAREFVVSSKTVQTHSKNINAKLGVNSRGARYVEPTSSVSGHVSAPADASCPDRSQPRTD